MDMDYERFNKGEELFTKVTIYIYRFKQKYGQFSERQVSFQF